jgi:5-formyltetrahydrofolate cyclo-ligase
MRLRIPRAAQLHAPGDCGRLPRVNVFPTSAGANRDHLRREMRKLRRSISPRERSDAARRFAIIADREHLLRPGARIAVYHAYGHEADVASLTRRAWRRGCQVFLPVITHVRAARMEFFRFTPRTPLLTNAFGIPEPDPARTGRIAARHLDIIFMPLVAFDDTGWRLGSGAGFYDRCVHHLRGSRRWRRPKLIGVAYEQQRIERLVPSAWDVPMDAVITQRGLRRFQPQH